MGNNSILQMTRCVWQFIEKRWLSLSKTKQNMICKMSFDSCIIAPRPSVVTRQKVALHLWIARGTGGNQFGCRPPGDGLGLVLIVGILKMRKHLVRSHFRSRTVWRGLVGALRAARDGSGRWVGGAAKWAELRSLVLALFDWSFLSRVAVFEKKTLIFCTIWRMESTDSLSRLLPYSALIPRIDRIHYSYQENKTITYQYFEEPFDVFQIACLVFGRVFPQMCCSPVMEFQQQSRDSKAFMILTKKFHGKKWAVKISSTSNWIAIQPFGSCCPRPPVVACQKIPSLWLHGGTGGNSPGAGQPGGGTGRESFTIIGDIAIYESLPIPMT